MKKIYSIFATLLLSVLAISCQCDMEMEEAGYLRLNVETSSVVTSTRIVSNYKSKQLAVKIVDAAGQIVEETNDYATWTGRQFRLQPGTYTITASSYGFDGSESGFDIPYYTGTTTATVTSGQEVEAEITCKLANVKVTVKFDESVLKVFKSASAAVSSTITGVNAQTFTAGVTTASAYFPVGNIISRLTVINQGGVTHTDDGETITGVKARDHIVLRYKVGEVGELGPGEGGKPNIDVQVDGSTKTYTFTFNVSTEAKTSLAITEVSPWAKLAYITGGISALENGKTLDPTKFTYEYKLSTANEWTTATATQSGTEYKATLKSLIPNTKYVCRLVYNDGTDSFASAEQPFTTEGATALENGNFDDWYQSGKTWYAASESYFSANGSFWDSSNPGTTTGAGAIVNINPTQGNSEVVHTAGGKSARLLSHFVSVFGITKFAAASIYSGSFVGLVGTNGAKLNFGQPFTARPTQLTGWYNYTPKNIDQRGSNTPNGIGEKGTPDLCSVYIALLTERIQVDNTDMSTFPDWNTDPRVIAYGEMSDAEAVPTNGWKQFTINLKYADLEKKPTHILILSSSSKYGDYFTGGEGSLLYLDDFELKYDAEPVSR